MNRWTRLDELLHEHVPWPPNEPCWISRSAVKGQGRWTVFSDSLPLRDIAKKSLLSRYLMNRYSQLDDILHEHVPWQPH